MTGTVTAGQSNLFNDTATAEILIIDDDAGFTLSASSVSLTEGDSSGGTYTLKLASDPVDNITVVVTSGDTDVVTVDTDANTAGNQSEIAFTGGSTGNWNTARTITLTAVDDTDTNEESVTITHAIKNPNCDPYDAAAPTPAQDGRGMARDLPLARSRDHAGPTARDAGTLAPPNPDSPPMRPHGPEAGESVRYPAIDCPWLCSGFRCVDRVGMARLLGLTKWGFRLHHNRNPCVLPCQAG